ncbi:hypothetical protein NKR23_g11574 [Pleurostoma richardsiae]|uniref:N-acetyltransferase domain-containing protein n=1 Tax=Pleurostoma richardsiae TaxID=41990 RepID=A0AA38R3J1_9PEZI|nr:hypothetical protein NKR23_g11574 [Pleurostoma richardsiae]
MTSTTLLPGYCLHAGFPSVEEYRYIRLASGLSPKTEAQAKGAIGGSWYGCYVSYQPPDENGTPRVVGMGRIIGDGGWYFHIADMGVLPQHQRKGLGDAILKNLLAHIKAQAPDGEAYVSLMADPPGRKLYARNGFVDSKELDEVGMVTILKEHVS